MDELGWRHGKMPPCCAHDLAGGGVNGLDKGRSVGIQCEGFEALCEALLADGIGGADVERFVDLPPYFWEGVVHASGLDAVLVLMGAQVRW